MMVSMRALNLEPAPLPVGEDSLIRQAPSIGWPLLILFLLMFIDLKQSEKHRQGAIGGLA
jgi:hypothetical protein